ncbi:DNA-3-methyladenine glycosylase 2 family protein [Vibrio sp. 10N]|uniref:DNA-3-methyladenine glycosylase 2 family protein n=1 Tax=Vibrio sp. 10N TaxID=3058938 RepID=UPI0030C70282
MTHEQYQRARLARDARFDGVFFVGVKTTGIFCRPICPANLPKEQNVSYFKHAHAALEAGYRPCLRCRPESAPNSWAWLGAETSFRRALTLIEQGALNQSSCEALSERLGISSRYLRQLFQTHLGIAPKKYAQYQQLMFAKQLLHHSQLSIADIGFACGFNSVRRFNDAFKKTLKLTPSQLRRSEGKVTARNEVYLAYRGAYDWPAMLSFFQKRAIRDVEYVTEQSYERYVDIDGTLGWFRLFADLEGKQSVRIEFELEQVTHLASLLSEIKRVFDLDTDINSVESHLRSVDEGLIIKPGLRLPGVRSLWEAGARAVLGQQVSVTAAVGQLNLLTETLDQRLSGQRVFPTAENVAGKDLSFLRMPESRKATLSRLANYLCEHPDDHPDNWLSIKGIGPWTVNYAKMRGLSSPDLLLSSDLIVKKHLINHSIVSAEHTAPWGSYATLHCWSHFS